jgi:hypothetical protein
LKSTWLFKNPKGSQSARAQWARGRIEGCNFMCNMMSLPLPLFPTLSYLFWVLITYFFRLCLFIQCPILLYLNIIFLKQCLILCMVLSFTSLLFRHHGSV